MREDERGSSLGLGNTAVLDQLLPIIFFFFCREKEKEWLAPTPLQACTKRGGVCGGGWDEVTMRLLLYSLHSVRISITVLGPRWKCAVQTTPNKCSVWLLAANKPSPPFSLLLLLNFSRSSYSDTSWSLQCRIQACSWAVGVKIGHKVWTWLTREL